MRKHIKFLFASLAIISLFVVNSYAAGWVDDGGGNWKYVDSDGIYASDVIRASGGDKYYLDQYGNMVRDYLLEDYNDAIYYFDDYGKMVKNTWVAVDQSQVFNQMDNPPSIYLYYFGNNGKAYKAKDKMVKKVIDGKKYFFNTNGQMMSGWINESGETFNVFDDTEADPFDGYCYYAGDETDGVLREGWTAWTEGSTKDRYYLKQTLWFYFKQNDNKKVQSTDEDTLLKKTINGKNYAFDDKGVMTEGWDAEALDPNNNNVGVNARKYYLEDSADSGRLAKREWIFAVPSQKQDFDDHEAETKRWFYASGSGDVVKGVMKKINKNYYAFDSNGIMKSGLCVIEKGTKKLIDTIDAERTDGKDFIVSRHYVSADTTSGSSVFKQFDDKTQTIYYFEMDETDASSFGKRKVLNATVPFGDDDYEFGSKNSGEYEGVQKTKKYYQNGILLKADSAMGLGLVFAGYCSSNSAHSIDYAPLYNTTTEVHPFAQEDKNHAGVYSDYIVLRDAATCRSYNAYPVYYAVGTTGVRIKKANSTKKDKNGNYWLIGSNGTVMGIYEVPIRYNKSGAKWQFKSEKASSVGGKIKTQWIDFGETDEYGKTCGLEGGKVDRDHLGDYAVYVNDVYALNFRFMDE